MAVRFDNADDRISYTGGAPNPAAGFTLTAWALVSVDQNIYQTIARLWNGGTAANLATSDDGTGGPNYFTGGGTVTSSTNFVVGEWRKVAMTCTGTTGGVYAATPAGATEADSGTVSGSTTPTSVTLGGRSTSDSSEWWNGRLAYVRVWSAVLSQAEIEAEWASTTPGRTSGLWADWPLETHTDLTDHSGNGRDLSAGATSTTTEDGPPLNPSITGSGSVTAPAATVSGAGAVTVSGTGSATAPSSAVSGAGSVIVSGTGSLTAAEAVVSGAAASIVSGSGTAEASVPVVAGAGSVVAAGQGGLLVPEAVVAGAGQVIITGSGVVVAPAAVVSGSDATPTETPASRTYTVPAESRMSVIPAESRVVEA